MNLSSLLGLLAALAVFFTAIFTATPAREIFLNPHGLLIVVGGTMAASLVCFPFSTLVILVKVFFKKVLGHYNQKHERVIGEIVTLAKGYRADANFLQNNLNGVKTEFLKEALDMVIQGGIDPQSVDAILRKRALTHFKRYEEEASIFKIIAKFPPAFGLLGTTLGMIGLLQKLGTPDSFKLLGPSMAIGLVATLYGIAITNLILIPIGENLSKLNKEDEVMREMVMDGIKLLRQKVHPLVVEEHLKSYLLPSERKKLNRAAA